MGEESGTLAVVFPRAGSGIGQVEKGFFSQEGSTIK